MKELEHLFTQELTKRKIGELRERVKRTFEEMPEEHKWDTLIFASWAIGQRQWYRTLFLVHACLSFVLLLALGMAIAFCR